MTGLKTLPDEFMGKSNIVQIWLPPNLEYVGRAFLAGCEHLTEIDVSSLVGVRTLPDHFMRGCTGLTSILLPPNVTEVGQFVLVGCTSLTKVDMSSLAALKTLRDNFMRGCTRMTSILLPPNVVRVGRTFMSHCINLVDVSPVAGMRKLVRIDRLGELPLMSSPFNINSQISGCGTHSNDEDTLLFAHVHHHSTVFRRISLNLQVAWYLLDF